MSFPFDIYRCGEEGANINTPMTNRIGPPLLVILMAPDVAIWAQQPQLLLDINSGSSNSSPSRFVDVSGSILFLASTPATGSELWRTDGTSGGTQLVKDIRPGPLQSSLRWLTAIDGTLYFSADDGVHGDELWKSDGSEAGTSMIKNINPVSNNSLYPGQPTGLDGFVYFTAGEPDTGDELWRTDGTETGTTLVKDIYPGGESSDVSQMIAVNGQLLFWAVADTNGWALWRSDGTEEGTVLVKDVEPEGTPTVLQEFYEVGGIAYFSGTDTIHGGELWRTDGTEAGTWMVKDIRPGMEGSWIAEMRVLGGGVIFSALTDELGRELWMSDGTLEGTYVVTDLNPGPEDGTMGLFNPVVVGDWLFFVGNDGTLQPPIGIYKSDGIETYLLTDLLGGIGSLSYGCEGVFFDGHDGIHGWELWYSNGTSSGTYMVHDINTGSSDSHPNDIVDVGDRIFFSATTSQLGAELWVCPCAAVGIAEPMADEGLIIGPVPTSGSVRIALPETDGAWQLAFIDVQGRTVHLIPGATGSILIDTNDWRTGVYELLARSNEKQLRGRMVVQ